MDGETTGDRQFETLVVERDAARPGLMTITLNRPDKLNALNLTLHDELQAVCHDLRADVETRVVIITGAGRAFSSGAELRDRRSTRPANDIDRRARVHIGGDTADSIERLDQVTIASINGLAVGGGVVLATCCDLRLAAESAWFSIPEVELEMPLTWHAIPRLMRELGPARTKELVMACDRFTSAQALTWGFLNHVVPDDHLSARTLALADRLLAMDPLSLASTKSACNAVANLMVPVEATWSDRELALLAYRQQALRRESGEQ